MSWNLDSHSEQSYEDAILCASSECGETGKFSKMNNTIWKFCLKEVTELRIPYGAEILSVAMQNDELCLWAKVDSKETLEKETRVFMVFSTGCKIPERLNLLFIGTVLIPSSNFEFHVFEVIPHI